MGEKGIDDLKIEGDLSCKQCKCYFLLEILSNKDCYLLKKYCKCDKILLPIEDNNKLLYNDLINIRNDDYFHSFKETIFNLSSYINKLFSCCFKSNKKRKTSISQKLSHFYCSYHNENLTGFCYLCYIPICKECIDENHKNHEIEYTKDLKISDYIVNLYKINLNTSFYKFQELTKLKYGKKYNIIQLSNLYVKEDEIKFKDFKDNQIYITLRLLKTIFDDYNKNKKRGYLNYQLISNLIKHANFKIIRIPDSNNSCKRYEGIGKINKGIDNTEFENKEILNENINIYLKIDLHDTNRKAKRFLFYREMLIDYIPSFDGKKLIKLQSKGLAICYNKKKEILLFKNYKKYSQVETHKNVKDFIQIKNGNLVVLFAKEIIIYNINKKLYFVKKEIELTFDINYKLKNIKENDFFLLSNNGLDHYLLIFCYPSYEGEKILLLRQKNLFGDCVYLNKTIVVVFLLNNIYKVFFYDINNKILKSIEIKSFNSSEKVNCFKIDESKLLLVDTFRLFVVNANTNQVVTYINYLYDINCFSKVNNFYLAGHGSGIITQVNKIFKILNCFKIKNAYKINNKEKFYSFVDMKNNRFCIFSEQTGFGLYKYIYN